jgi:hypothetical protein
MDQTHAVFMPGLTRRGPVYNSTYAFGSYLSALPVLSPTMTYAILAAIGYLGLKKTIPLWAAGAAAVAVWKMNAGASAPVVANVGPIAPIAPFDSSGMVAPAALNGFYVMGQPTSSVGPPPLSFRN